MPSSARTCKLYQFLLRFLSSAAYVTAETVPHRFSSTVLFLSFALVVSSAASCFLPPSLSLLHPFTILRLIARTYSSLPVLKPAFFSFSPLFSSLSLLCYPHLRSFVACFHGDSQRVHGATIADTITQTDTHALPPSLTPASKKRRKERVQSYTHKTGPPLLTERILSPSFSPLFLKDPDEVLFTPSAAAKLPYTDTPRPTYTSTRRFWFVHSVNLPSFHRCLSCPFETKRENNKGGESPSSKRREYSIETASKFEPA